MGWFDTKRESFVHSSIGRTLWLERRSVAMRLRANVVYIYSKRRERERSLSIWTICPLPKGGEWCELKSGGRTKKCTSCTRTLRQCGTDRIIRVFFICTLSPRRPRNLRSAASGPSGCASIAVPDAHTVVSGSLRQSGPFSPMIKLPFKARGSMASELVNVATNEKLKEVDWTKNIEVCELVARNHSQGNDVIRSIKKRLRNNNPNVQLFSVMLLEMLLNNCGEYIHKQMIDNELLPILIKIVKKKNELPVRERIFLLLDAAQTAVGGASGKFPQYYAAYYDLVSKGVQFPRTSHVVPANLLSGNVQSNNLPSQGNDSTKSTGVTQQQSTQAIPDSSIIQKATGVLEILRDVLDALDVKHPEGASDEFTLDLVEQCSFQKQRVMHLIMTSREEKVVFQAIELNEQLHMVLAKHDALLSAQSASDATCINHVETDEEEDLDRLLHRIRKGKACVEDYSDISPGSFKSNQRENPRWATARPLCIEPLGSNGPPPITEVPPSSLISNQRVKPRWASAQPLSKEPLDSYYSDTTPAVTAPIQRQSPLNGSDPVEPPLISIPPPPTKHTEREKFFKEKHVDGNSSLAAHLRGLSLDSRGGSSSQSGSGSTDFSDRDPSVLRDW